jgi:hypothetical protein
MPTQQQQQQQQKITIPHVTPISNDRIANMDAERKPPPSSFSSSQEQHRPRPRRRPRSRTSRSPMVFHIDDIRVTAPPEDPTTTSAFFSAMVPFSPSLLTSLPQTRLMPEEETLGSNHKNPPYPSNSSSLGDQHQSLSTAALSLSGETPAAAAATSIIINNSNRNNTEISNDRVGLVVGNHHHRRRRRQQQQQQQLQVAMQPISTTNNIRLLSQAGLHLNKKRIGGPMTAATFDEIIAKKALIVPTVITMNSTTSSTSGATNTTGMSTATTTTPSLMIPYCGNNNANDIIVDLLEDNDDKEEEELKSCAANNEYVNYPNNDKNGHDDNPQQHYTYYSHDNGYDYQQQYPFSYFDKARTDAKHKAIEEKNKMIMESQKCIPLQHRKKLIPDKAIYDMLYTRRAFNTKERTYNNNIARAIDKQRNPKPYKIQQHQYYLNGKRMKATTESRKQINKLEEKRR